MKEKEIKVFRVGHLMRDFAHDYYKFMKKRQKIRIDQEPLPKFIKDKIQDEI